jgi:RimJ/RimL family protein N-acetyltransferase
MVRLPSSDVSRVRHLFDSEHLVLVVDAVIAGNSPASVWADNVVAPQTALIWDGHHCVYLAGALVQVAAWSALLRREIMPRGRGMLKAYVTAEAAATVFGGYALQRRERVLYRGGQLAISDWPSRLSAEFRISAINDRFAELDRLNNFADVTAEIESGWHSVADFRRTGFGFAAHDDETIVCWCTAEYVSDGQCGVGIETVEAYRGRGFATLTASAFVEHCVERGVIPHWDAWTSNLPSAAVAEKVGFRKSETYSIFVGDFADCR